MEPNFLYIQHDYSSTIEPSTLIFGRSPQAILSSAVCFSFHEFVKKNILFIGTFAAKGLITVMFPHCGRSECRLCCIIRLGEVFCVFTCSWDGPMFPIFRDIKNKPLELHLRLCRTSVSMLNVKSTIRKN